MLGVSARKTLACQQYMHIASLSRSSLLFTTTFPPNPPHLPRLYIAYIACSPLDFIPVSYDFISPL